MTAQLDGLRCHHSVLVIDADDTLDKVLVPVLRRHAAGGEPVLLVVGAHTERVLRQGLGDAADRLEWGAQEQFYRQLGLAYSGFMRHLREQSAHGRRVHVFGEPGYAGERLTAYLPYEAFYNEIFPAFGSPLTCVYDQRTHPAGVIEEMRQVHSEEWTERGCLPNATYVPPGQFLNDRLRPLAPVPPHVEVDTVVCDLSELTTCRTTLGRWAAAHHLPQATLAQVLVAVNEVVTNGLGHGRTPVRVRAWRHETNLVVQADDHGGRRIPPDAGYRPPKQPRDPMGLWAARQAADILATDTSGGLTSVRMSFPHPPSVS
ncbi:sensor histidine kinase [Actinoplanes sp. NEAU-A12]|uniref:Sensor histidine kinase n=1 Tax=Actinoplanes sandaracinus TaxID=3045177 RepID=A0ABT6X1U7_9ACTN|nr:sensor histidine kinase [Actinoplanes sandaracinus]MDI6105907.1 sensor histidine kinase [Actinoplanes sandaracinus]